MSCISKLPPEVLTDIFAQCAHGPTSLPFSPNTPIQIVISLVCSSWRHIALGTGELWANVYIRSPSRNQHIYSAWLTRAGQHPISLHLNFDYDDVEPPIPSTFWMLVNQFPIRHLRLTMTAKDFDDLWALGHGTLPYLEHLDIQFSSSDPPVPPVSFNIPAAVIGKIRSVTFYDEAVEWTSPLSFPWAQLRHLGIHECIFLSQYITILRETPLLEHCTLTVLVDEAAKDMKHLTLSHLQSLVLLFSKLDDLNAIIRHFTCPNLTELDIEEISDWSTATWDIIRNQYNLHRLQQLSLYRRQPLSNPILSSTIFRDAPMLRNLQVGQVAIMDEETCAGMVTGDFGRFLHSLTISCKQSDVGVVLGTVKDRQLAVAERLRPGCTRQDEMASLKELILCYWAGTDGLDTFGDEMFGELKRLGVGGSITVRNPEIGI